MIIIMKGCENTLQPFLFYHMNMFQRFRYENIIKSTLKGMDSIDNKKEKEKKGLAILSKFGKQNIFQYKGNHSPYQTRQSSNGRTIKQLSNRQNRV